MKKENFKEILKKKKKKGKKNILIINQCSKMIVQRKMLLQKTNKNNKEFEFLFKMTENGFTSKDFQNIMIIKDLPYFN